MATWREKLALHFGSSYFMGISLGEWLGLLRQNQFAISPTCWLRAAMITLFSMSSTPGRWLENTRFRRQWEAVEIPPPVFVLGHYRSGTTHLHNLLAVDDRFAYLNAYQATYPGTFLLTEKLGAGMFEFLMPRSRPFDNVRLGFDVPYEDEIALTSLVRLTPYMTVVFPRRRQYYDRFLTFEHATAEELAKWRAGFRELLQKLTLKYGRPLVLKSPPHTGRIRLLLEMFPDARFVHIHRDPYVVIQSTIHLIRIGLEWLRLQDTHWVDWTERALDQWRDMYDAYFEQRSLIPAENLHEIAFRDLERDPIGELRRMYEVLRLPRFDDVEPRMNSYLASIAGYQKNKFNELPVELKARIRETCRRGFDEWGYPK